MSYQEMGRTKSIRDEVCLKTLEFYWNDDENENNKLESKMEFLFNL